MRAEDIPGPRIGFLEEPAFLPNLHRKPHRVWGPTYPPPEQSKSIWQPFRGYRARFLGVLVNGPKVENDQKFSRPVIAFTGYVKEGNALPFSPAQKKNAYPGRNIKHPNWQRKSPAREAWVSCLSSMCGSVPGTLACKLCTLFVCFVSIQTEKHAREAKRTKRKSHRKSVIHNMPANKGFFEDSLRVFRWW
jgi:hypothetical protein